MKQGMKVFLACAFGAFIGALVGLQLHRNIWWIGLIVGFVGGYLCYDLRTAVKVFLGLCIAASKRVTSLRSRTFAKATGLNLLGFLAVYTIIAPVSLALFHWYHWKPITIYSILALAIFCATLFPLIIAREDMKDYMEDRTQPDLNEWFVEYRKGRVDFARNANIFIYWWVLCFLWREIFYPLIRIIHSDVRLLCGLDAAIGVAIGHYFGNAAIGALAGGVFGVLNYEIVSKRILKIAT